MASKFDSVRVRVYEGHSIGQHDPVVNRREFKTVTLGTVKRWIKADKAKSPIYGYTRDQRTGPGYGTITISYYVRGLINNHRYTIETV